MVRFHRSEYMGIIVQRIVLQSQLMINIIVFVVLSVFSAGVEKGSGLNIKSF